MKRREFLKAGLATGGTALIPGEIFAAKKEAFTPQIRKAVQERQSHPLYFDALTFPGSDYSDIRKSGLSGFVWDITKGTDINNKYIRAMKPTYAISYLTGSPLLPVSHYSSDSYLEGHLVRTELA